MTVLAMQRPRYVVRNQLHMLRVGRSVYLTLRVRTRTHWTIGISYYGESMVRDLSLHLGVVSIGVKQQRGAR